MEKITLIATSIFGIEALVRQELKDLGFKILSTADGRVEFEATLQDIPRANLWLRTADRVLLKIAAFPAGDFDALFDTVKDLPWSKWITKDGRIDIMARCLKSKIHSNRTCQSMVKKAIIENLKKKYKVNWLKETGAQFTVHVVIFKDQAWLAVDTSGDGLHKRGYRQDRGEVPLRENLAAALVLFSGWKKDRPLIDPMCGSGTLLIEAAMQACSIAPGINRKFASEQWPCIDKKHWSQARQQARKAIKQPDNLSIQGFDIERARIQDSQKNARRAGVDAVTTFKRKDIAELTLVQQKGTLISNPPYGIKLADKNTVHGIYDALNELLKNKNAWAVYIITGDKQFARHFKLRRPDKVRRLYHGTIQVDFFQYG